jgi:hypothetical protein
MKLSNVPNYPLFYLAVAMVSGTLTRTGAIYNSDVLLESDQED